MEKQLEEPASPEPMDSKEDGGPPLETDTSSSSEKDNLSLLLRWIFRRLVRRSQGALVGSSLAFGSENRLPVRTLGHLGHLSSCDFLLHLETEIRNGIAMGVGVLG